MVRVESWGRRHGLLADDQPQPPAEWESRGRPRTGGQHAGHGQRGAAVERAPARQLLSASSGKARAALSPTDRGHHSRAATANDQGGRREAAVCWLGTPPMADGCGVPQESAADGKEATER